MWESGKYPDSSFPLFLFASLHSSFRLINDKRESSLSPSFFSMLTLEEILAMRVKVDTNVDQFHLRMWEGAQPCTIPLASNQAIWR